MTYEEFKRQEHEKLTRLVDAMIDSLSRGISPDNSLECRRILKEIKNLDQPY